MDLNIEITGTALPEHVAQEWAAFFNTMLQQMYRNRDRGFEETWLKDPLDKQFQTLQMSVQEARVALTYGIDLEDKLADVANWACIIGDNYKNGLLKRLTGD